MEKLTDYKDASTYNNFYEFGTDKADPARNAGIRLKAHALDGGGGRGCVKKPARYALEDLLKLSAHGRAHLPPALRGRLVDGDPLGGLLHERSSSRRWSRWATPGYVEFITQADPKTMPFVGSRVLDWPYVEGLRMDEAMNPLTLLDVRHVWRGAAQPERCTGAAGGAMEVRLQERQRAW
jgi:sulfoxide reductase catalytic subunit YedY